VPKLTILGPDAPERQVDLAGRDLRIGRDDQNDIVLPDSSKSVSRYHAELRFEDGQYVLLDLKSQNGLWVGGRRVSRIPLQPGVPVLVGSYRLVLDDAPAEAHTVPAEADTAPTDAHTVPTEAHTVVGSLPAGAPSSIPSRAPEPARPKPAPPVRASSGPGVRTSAARSKKAALFGGVAAVMVLALIVVGLRRRNPTTDQIPPASARTPVNSPPTSPLTQASPASEDLIRTYLAHAKSLLEDRDPVGALAELDRLSQIDPSNPEVSDLKARANELKNPPQAPVPQSPGQSSPRPSPPKLPEPASGPQPVLARKPGESPEDWHTRDRAVATRYDRAKAEVDSDAFQAAIRDLKDLQRDEPNYLNVPTLLQRAQGRARTVAQGAIEQGANLEKQGQFPEALQQYRRALTADPSVPGGDESVQKVLARMKADGAEAYNSAMTYYTLAKYPQAIALFEKAVKLLPDGDPDKKTAQDKLAEAKSRQ
jgi:pSer/pThr/pTyr-binding forkhead associated (FHA) protein/tetratricopeptide (TPR) repeat protein